MSDWRVLVGDCVEVMAAMEVASADAICTDPPYALGFMSKAWDSFGSSREDGSRGGVGDKGILPGYGRGGTSEDRFAYRQREARTFQAWCETWAAEALRVLKPGGHLLAFGGTRTSHRLVCAIEDAGFEIRDTIAWMYGSGFPKSLDVSKAIDASAGHLRGQRGEVISGNGAMSGPNYERTVKGDPVTATAAAWQGWGTALKPAYEPIIVARKPLDGTVAANVLEHGTGALNVDGCRIGTDAQHKAKCESVVGLDSNRNGVAYGEWTGERESSWTPAGRWPANVVLDEEAARLLDEQTGTLHSQDPVTRRSASVTTGVTGFTTNPWSVQYADSGGASRFFYVAKASSAERNAGLDGLDAQRVHRYSTRGAGTLPQQTPAVGTVERNIHPTVKPIALMRWLVRLVTPPGGTVLDPFAGSGTTGIAAALEGFEFVGIEREPEYAAIADARIAWWRQHPDGMELVRRLALEKERCAVEDAGQVSIFDLLGKAT